MDLSIETSLNLQFQLEGRIGEKLPARITGLRQAFRSNDPMGKGSVSRYY